MKSINNILFIFFVVTISILCGISSKSVAAKSISLVVKDQGKDTSCKSEYPKIYLDDAKTSNNTTDFPVIKFKKIWMGSVDDLFQKQLQCKYQVQQKDNAFSLSNQNTDTILYFQIGNTEATLVDSEGKNTVALAYSPVVVHNPQTNTESVYLPISQVGKLLGFDTTIYSLKNTIRLNTLTLLDLDYSYVTFDPLKYTNELTTLTIEQNSSKTRQELYLATVYDITEKDITMEEDPEAGKIVYTLHNMYSAIPEFSTSLNTKYIRQIELSSNKTDLILSITYNQKYEATSLLDENGFLTSFSSAKYSLRIKLPNEVAFASIKDQDLYLKNKFKIIIPGNWKEYYNTNPIFANNNVISSLSVKNTENNTVIEVKTKKIQGYKLQEHKGYFTVMIDDPSKIYPNIVVLDAGHGDFDHGAAHSGYKEKNLNLKIIYTLAKEYFDGKDSNIKAYWTRTDDTFVSLQNRAKFASKVGADLFVSLHMNSCNYSTPKGIEVYYSKENNKTTASGLNSKQVAKRMEKKLLQDLKPTPDTRGVKTARYYVTRYNTVPAILIELGFMSNSSDLSHLTDSEYQKNAAKSIFDCISNVFKEYPSER